MKLKKILIFLFVLQIVFSVGMKILSYIGSDSAELQSRTLQYFTSDDIKIGIEYGRRGFFVRIASQIIDFILLGVFAFSPLAIRIEEYLVAKTKNHYYPMVFLFFLSFSVIEFILSLPLQYYFGFVLEHQFGFSKMTLGEWILFTAKSALVGLGLGTVLSMGAAFILKTFERTWKYLIPIGSLVLGLVFSILYPILITPIFYDYKPIDEGSLKTKIVNLCDQAQIKVENVYVINESKYSGHTNAYFTGWGENRKIFLYDTLIKNHTEEEVISVLGHEIGHWTHNHELTFLVGNTIEMFLLCLLIGIIFQIAKNGNEFVLKEIYSPSSWPILFLIISIAGTITNPFWNTFSRYQEAQADMEALVLTNDKKSFIDTEIKMAKDNKSRLNPHPWVVFYSYSHPMTIERIRMAEEFQAK
ncbi:MAG TPA: M48 family metallopeptidase [Leptospiraceae bacterium]|nr:M48 family metallopeptidase [Leptospiraceae bacterium]